MSPQAIVWQQSSDFNSSLDSFWNQMPISGLDWKPFVPTAAVITIPVTVIIILICVFVYYFKLRNQKPDVAPTGYVLLVQMMVISFENLTVELLGERYRKITPYFLMLMSYITVSNLLALVGLSPPTGSLTVTFSMGLITFIGTIYMGFRHQRLSYLKTFALKLKYKNKSIPIMINPFSILGEVSPLLSISMRLWGNIFAGTLILALFYSFMQFLFSNVNPTILGLVLGSTFGGLISPVFHLYFDLTIGLIQAYVFVMLTYTYWSNQMMESEKGENNSTKSIKIKTTNLSSHDRI
ncbi:F0F1 ATP synthase subunit A [Mycoplasmoides alvi]|uniref:F0F1 ATP synthase subunit A n=1 Tax=Mycoplasmoides alvi TaxID=78580 RepID=UPI0009FF934F|nr:F0F1 ATP synthase subunit A [Mycoplasmoides alvi]